MNIEQIRQDFPILSRKIDKHPLCYLDNAATTQKPQQVIQTISDFYSETNANIHRGIHSLSEESERAYENARAKVQTFLNAKKAEEIIFTRGTTESINLVAHCFTNGFLKKGDEIIVSEMEHHSNLVPWQMACKQSGAKLRKLPFDEKGELEINKLPNLLNDKTRLLALTGVSNVLGTRNPVEKIIRMAHSAGVPVLIDAAQLVQHERIDVQEWDCDFLAFSGHKIYAETGIGVLYGKEDWLEKLPPYQGGGGMIDHVSFNTTTYGKLPFKFEAGTPHYVGAVSLNTALNYIDSIGLDKIAKHESSLIGKATQALSSFPGIHILGNPEKRVGAISFNLEGIHPTDIGMILNKLGIAVRTGHHCAQPVMQHYGIDGCVRASFACYNTAEEIETLLKGLEKAQSMLL